MCRCIFPPSIQTGKWRTCRPRSRPRWAVRAASRRMRVCILSIPAMCTMPRAVPLIARNAITRLSCVIGTISGITTLPHRALARNAELELPVASEISKNLSVHAGFPFTCGWIARSRRIARLRARRGHRRTFRRRRVCGDARRVGCCIEPIPSRKQAKREPLRSNIIARQASAWCCLSVAR